MYRCRICRFEVSLDDVRLRFGDDCICLRCFEHVVKDERPVAKRLQRDVEEE